MSEETKQLFERQESKLSAQSAAFMKYLVKKGLISDSTIQDPDVRKAKQEKQRVMFHNTQLLLKHYRNIKWVLECFPDTVAEDLDMPYHSLDTLLSGIDVQLSLENVKLQHRLQSLHKSRLLMDRLNEALTMLQKKPGNGELILPGATFALLDESGRQIAMATSDTSGMVKFEKIPHGKLNIREVYAPEGYVVSGKLIPVEVTETYENPEAPIVVPNSPMAKTGTDGFPWWATALLALCVVCGGFSGWHLFRSHRPALDRRREKKT